MEQFLINISSFPVSVYTVGLGVVTGYWLIAVVGLVDFDIFSADVDLELDTDVGQIGTIAGLLTTLGLSGVPITIVLSLLMLNGWFICYFVSKLVPSFPDMFSLVEILLDLSTIVVSFMISIFVTAVMIKPLKPLFKKINNEPISRSIIGRTCRVRSSRVDQNFGEVECIYQGASLILKVRSYDDELFNTGDMVVLTEHQPSDESFLVVSEQKFKKEIEQ